MLHETEQTYYESLARLNARQQVFVSHYLACGNATRAARKAGYSDSSPHTAEQIGYETLRRPEVAAAVQAGLTLIAARCEVDAERVVRELAAVAFASSHHYEAAQDGTLVVAEGAPPEAGLALQVKHRRVVKADGSIEVDTTYTKWSFT